MLSLMAYKILDSKFYVFIEPNLSVNRIIANGVNEKFTKQNSIMVYRSWVRGYLNTLFDRGIYEKQALDNAIKIAYGTGKQYAVEIKPNEGYDYYDTVSGEVGNVRYENGKLTEQLR
jgi:hypothetical protein